MCFLDVIIETERARYVPEECEELTNEDIEERALQQRINEHEAMLEGYGDR